MTIILPFFAQFYASGAPATGLTVTVDIDGYAIADGTRTALVTAGSATECRNGLYRYWYTTADISTYSSFTVSFKTSGTADQTVVPSLQLDFAKFQAAAIAAAAPASTALTNATWTDARAGYLDTLNGIVANVWAYATRTLSSVAAIVTGVWSDNTSYSAGTKGHAVDSAGAADPLTNAVPGSYASGTAGFALGKIANTTVTVTAPVGANSVLTLNVGDDYKAADGRSIDITSSVWPSLTGATITFRARMGQTEVVTVTGSVLSATAARVELTAANTQAIGRGRGTYDIRAALATSTNEVTLMSGILVMNTI